MRRQVQLPEVAIAQPQARPTDQFVQSKPNYPMPKAILDISRFSQTLSGLVAQSAVDQHERAMAQGEMDATFAAPFGAGTATTPEGEANRKAFKGAQESGQILPSEDPWYRIGVLTAEGRRAALNVHEHVNSAENINAAARVYDKNGDFIPFEQREDPIAIFERQKMPFMNVPALQSIYGRKAAAQMLESARAHFVTQVSGLRDKQTQEYHETQVVDQIVHQVERVEITGNDKSPEGQAQHAEAMAGMADLLHEQTVKWNLPDGPKVLRQAGLAAIEWAASDPKKGSPEHALAMIDLYRKVPIGPTTIGADNSEDGVAFRMELDRLEAHYNEAFGSEGEREEKNAKLYKESYLRRVEDGVSEGFASGLPPSAVRIKLETRIKAEVEPRFQDEALKILDGHYADAQNPMPNNAAADEQLAAKILHEPVGDIDAWIGSIAGREVSYGQASTMRKTLQAEAEAWKNLPDVKLASDAIDAEVKVFAADRSEGVQDSLRDLTNDQVASANQRIQLRARGLNGQQRAEQMGGIVKEEYAKATQALDLFKADIRTRSTAFDIELRNANNKGVNFEQKIDEARVSGLITRSEFRSSVEANQKASDISHYTEDTRVQNMVPRLFPTPEAFNNAMLNVPWVKFEDARIRAFELAQQWAITERGKYESPRDADTAFTEFVNTKMRREVANTMGLSGADKPPGESSKPGGPTQLEEDQAGDGKSFQTLLEGASHEVLKLAAVKAYPVPDTLAKKDLPQSIGKFQANFGQQNGLMPKIRAQARAEMATLARFDAGDQKSLKAALLNAGAASPGELLRGSMEVGGVSIPIVPGDLDPWKALMFASTAQLKAACANDRDTVYELSEKFGVQEADFAPWVKQQALLLKVNGL